MRPISHFESLLREALAPVEPPEDLVERLEGTLTSITEMAADELEAWELSAMRDPRNWARPAAALVVGRRGRHGARAAARAARAQQHAAADHRRSPREPPSARCATSSARRAACSATARSQAPRGSGAARERREPS